MIYDDLEYKHEADIFANQQKYVKPLLPYEIFMANLEAGSNKHLTINALVESYDLAISHKACPGAICAVSTLEQIFDKYGYHTLDRVLALCIGTWKGEHHSFSANMLNGVARMVNAYGDSLKDDTFKEKNGIFSVKQIIRTAKERGAGSLGYAEVLLMNYNKKTHSSLPMEKLYTHKIKTKDDDVLWEEDNEDDVAPKTPEETLPMENAQLNLDL